MACALVVGLLAAIGKLSRVLLLRGTIEVYTTIIRGIPELVLLLLIYYGVPTLIQDTASTMGFDVALSINPFVAGIGTLTIIYGAFACEVYRSAYLAVPAGQRDAADALGLDRLLAFRKVVLPQMIRYALPGLGNVWMVLVKATALISVIQLPELMRNADIAARSTRMPFTFFFAACLLYLVITLISMWGQARMERWARRGIEASAI
jgi:polar amino acid transport system permease protein/arginine/ornithine transport system permease protein